MENMHKWCYFQVETAKSLCVVQQASSLTAATQEAMCPRWCCHKTVVPIAQVPKGLCSTDSRRPALDMRGEKEKNFCWVKPLRCWGCYHHTSYYTLIKQVHQKYTIHHLKIIYSLSMSNFCDHQVFQIRAISPSLNKPTSFLKVRSREKPTFGKL